MTNPIRTIPLAKLIAHPDNPNRLSKVNFDKLTRNIERTGRYEPLIVRPHPEKVGCFQIINGHHRCGVLAKLGCETADCIVWDVDDKQTDILLATLNRLGGSDVLAKKLAILKRLNERTSAGELAKLIPQTAKQIEKLTELKRPAGPAKIKENSFATPLVFFVDDAQNQLVENALASAQQPKTKLPKALKRAAALTEIAQLFLENSNGKNL